MASTSKLRRLVRWALAVAYSGFIFAYAFVVVRSWIAFTNYFGVERGGKIVDTAVPIIGVLACLLIVVAIGRRPLRSYLWLAAVLAGYAYLLTLWAVYPVERIHLLVYSLLAWMYFRALRLDFGLRGSLVGAAVAVFVVGTADEVLQRFIPDRSMSLEDMILNWCAGGLGIVGLVALSREAAAQWTAAPNSIRKFAVSYVLPVALAAGLGHQVWTQYLYPPLNVILVTVDCARPDRFGVYGYERDTTPYLNDLMKDGVRFDNAYSQAAWTSPGVVSTLTGLYPRSHGVVISDRSVFESVDTLLDIFKREGYLTPDMTYLTAAPNFYNLGGDKVEGIDVTVSGEIGSIAKWISDNHRKPFFLWYHYRSLHFPYNPRKGAMVFPPALPENEPPPVIRDVVQKEVIIPWGEAEFTEEHKPWLDSLYDAQVRQFDSKFEAIRYRLSLHRILKNTLIVITADHGDELLEHGYVGHASTAVHSRHYDEHIHIPLMMYGPRVVPKKQAFDNLVEQVDVAPTIVDAMGWEIPADMQGRSLLPLMRGEPFEDRPVFAESIEGGYQSKEEMKDHWLRSVRTKDWKLIVRTSPEGEQFELYNLKEDPGEHVNVYADEPEVRMELMGALTRWITRTIDDRIAFRERERLLLAKRQELADAKSAPPPEIIAPENGITIDYESSGGQVVVKWTGNPKANYIIQYHIGTGWHTLKGKLENAGTEKLFGPVPRDGWAPLHQWNPFRLRVRQWAAEDKWSDWLVVNVAPLDEK